MLLTIGAWIGSEVFVTSKYMLYNLRQAIRILSRCHYNIKTTTATTKSILVIRIYLPDLRLHVAWEKQLQNTASPNKNCVHSRTMHLRLYCEYTSQSSVVLELKSVEMNVWNSFTI